MKPRNVTAFLASIAAFPVIFAAGSLVAIPLALLGMNAAAMAAVGAGFGVGVAGIVTAGRTVP